MKINYFDSEEANVYALDTIIMQANEIIDFLSPIAHPYIFRNAQECSLNLVVCLENIKNISRLGVPLTPYFETMFPEVSFEPERILLESIIDNYEEKEQKSHELQYRTIPKITKEERAKLDLILDKYIKFLCDIEKDEYFGKLLEKYELSIEGFTRFYKNFDAYRKK